MSIKDGIREGQQSPWVGHFSGVIATPAASADDPVYFTLPRFDPQVRWGPAKWMPGLPGNLPNRGDQCIVVFNETRTPIVTAWWPENPVGMVGGTSFLNGPVGAEVVAELDGAGRTGLVGSVTWELLDVNGNVIKPPSTAGVSLFAGATDKYVVQIVRPGPAGIYAIRWTIGALTADEFFTTT